MALVGRPAPDFRMSPADATFVCDRGDHRHPAWMEFATGKQPFPLVVRYEVVRVIAALQTGQKTAANWSPGQPTLMVQKAA